MIELTMPFTEMTAADFQRHLDERSVNTHDPDKVIRWFGEDAVQRHVAGGRVSRGKNEIHAAMADLFRTFPDVHLSVRSLFTAGDRTCVEVTMTGTHDGDLAGIPATGRPVECDMCLVFRWDADGVVAEEVIYSDSAGVLRQIGVLPDA